MKKIIFHLILIAPLILHAQKNTEELSDEAFKKIEASKSGNYKDVLFSFMQAAFKSTDINEKKLELNSTLYKILADNNKEIFSNYTRNQIRFVRNFQLNLKLDFDDKFKSKGFTSGITLAIINGRDKSFVDYTETLLQVKYDDYLDLLHEAQNEQIIAKEKDDDVTDASEIILNQEIIPDDKKVLVTKMKNSISSKIASSKKYNDLKDAEGNAISISDNDSFVTYIHSIKSKLDKDLESKPLLTISADGSTNTNGKFDRLRLELFF